jgi:toxin FitB
VIVLDTNVVSELMKPMPEPRVLAWLRKHRLQELFLTSLTEAELWFGVELLPAGKRRNEIGVRVRTTLEQDFAGRILDFDRQAAREFGRLHAAQRRSGRLPPLSDAMISAIASARQFAVATRNVRDFTQAGLTVFNPWTD